LQNLETRKDLNSKEQAGMKGGDNMTKLQRYRIVAAEFSDYRSDCVTCGGGNDWHAKLQKSFAKANLDSQLTLTVLAVSPDARGALVLAEDGNGNAKLKLRDGTFCLSTDAFLDALASILELSKY